MSFLLDTNVVSELARPKANRGLDRWAQTHFWVYLSTVTIEEIYYGLEWKPNPRVLEWFNDFVDERCEALPVSAEIARASGTLRGHFQARGITRQQADILIAATAAVHGLTLVTRNVADLEGCGVALLNPFS